MNLKRETTLEEGRKFLFKTSFVSGVKQFCYIWTAICVFFAVIGILVLITDPSPESRDGNKSDVFSSDYGGTIQVSDDVFIKGCVWETAVDGGVQCNERWFHPSLLHRYYVPRSERRYPEDIALESCIFVEKNMMSTCEPVWFVSY